MGFEVVLDNKEVSGGIDMSNILYQGKFFEHFGGLKDTRLEEKV